MKRIARIAAAVALLLLVAGLAFAAWPDPLEPVAGSGPRISAERALVLRDRDGPERAAAFSPDGSLLATAAAAGPVLVRRTGSWELVASLPHPGGVTDLAFAPDGNWIASAGYDGRVRLWELPAGDLIRAIPVTGKTLWTLDVSPDGRLLATGGEDNLVRLWNARTGALLHTLDGHDRNVWEVRFSPDGETLASASFDRSIKLWRVSDGAPVRTLNGHEQAVVGLDYSPDGQWLASSGDDSTIRFWQAGDGAPHRTLRSGNHTYQISFSPDGHWLASAGRGRTAALTFWHELTGLGGKAEALRLWRVADGALVQSLDLDEDSLAVPAISPDMRWLVTGDEGSAVTVWRLTKSN